MGFGRQKLISLAVATPLVAGVLGALNWYSHRPPVNPSTVDYSSRHVGISGTSHFVADVDGDGLVDVIYAKMYNPHGGHSGNDVLYVASGMEGSVRDDGFFVDSAPVMPEEMRSHASSLLRSTHALSRSFDEAEWDAYWARRPSSE